MHLLWGLLFICCGFLRTSDATLKLVQLVWRHGDRTPISTIPSDPDNGPDSWPQGPGELTVEGMLQHYQTGQYFRQRYAYGKTKGGEKFLNSSYSTSEVLITSSDYNRSIQSVLANLAGFYPSDGFGAMDIKWRPVPVHVNSTLIFGPGYLGCPYYDKLFNDLHESDAWKFRESQRKSFYELLTKETNWSSPINGTNLGRIYDALTCDKWHNRTLPDWATPDVYEKIDRYALADPLDDATWCRFKTGFLLDEILTRMLDKAQPQGHRPDPNPRLKLLIYSTHDVIVEHLLRSLGIYNDINPPYCSTLIFELHQIGGQYFVKILYRNTTKDYASDDPMLMSVFGCPDSGCPISHFVEKCQPYTLNADNYKAECRLSIPEQELRQLRVLTAIFGAATVVLFILLLLSQLQHIRRERKLKKYRHFVSVNGPGSE